MLYLIGDYNDKGALTDDYHDFLFSKDRLGKLQNRCVQFAIQVDGNESLHGGRPDTTRWLWTPNDGLEPQKYDTEQPMNAASSLSDFLVWGQTTLPAPYYSLTIADHGDGIRGIGWDHTSDIDGNAYLRAGDIRNALAADTVFPIHVLHLDACSMGLLDISFQLRDKVEYMITSQFLAWNFFSYEDYAASIDEYTPPEQLARTIVTRYHELATDYSVPHTIAAWRLARVEAVKNGLDDLAVLLRAWVGNDNESRTRYMELLTLRNTSQFFDSDGTYDNSPLDSYIDLVDWLNLLQAHFLTDTDIHQVTNQLLTELALADGLVMQHEHGNGLIMRPDGVEKAIDLSRSHGVSLYYPLEGTDRLVASASNSSTALQAGGYTQLYVDYINNELFDLTLASRWDEFLRAAYDVPGPDITPQAPNPPLPPLQAMTKLYLPIIQR